MKRIARTILTFFISLLFLVSLNITPANAEPLETNNIYDDLSVLSKEETEDLNSQINNMDNALNIVTSIVITSGLDDLNSAASDFFNDNENIANTPNGGALLLIDTSKNIAGIYTIGGISEYISEEKINLALNCITNYLSDSDYYTACQYFINYISLYVCPLLDVDYLLSDDEYNDIYSMIDQIRSSFNIDIVICITSNLNNSPIKTFSESLYRDNKFGFGDTHDGFILTLDTANDYLWISTFGSSESISLLDSNTLQTIVNNVSSTGELTSYSDIIQFILTSISDKLNS